jgi:hypothetical protein
MSLTVLESRSARKACSLNLSDCLLKNEFLPNERRTLRERFSFLSIG